MNNQYEIRDVNKLYGSEHLAILETVAKYSENARGLKPVGVVDLLMRPQAYVARKAGEIAGFVSIERPEIRDGLPWSKVSTVAVFPGFENQGVGTALVRNATDYIHGVGVHAYALIDRDPTLPALPSFVKNGYGIHQIDGRIGVINCWQPKESHLELVGSSLGQF